MAPYQVSVPADSNVRKVSRPDGPITHTVKVGLTEHEFIEALRRVGEIYDLPKRAVRGYSDRAAKAEFAVRSWLRQEDLIPRDPPKLASLVADHPVELRDGGRFPYKVEPLLASMRPADEPIDVVVEIGMTSKEMAALAMVQQLHGIPRTTFNENVTNTPEHDLSFVAEHCMRLWLEAEGALDGRPTMEERAATLY